METTNDQPADAAPVRRPRGRPRDPSLERKVLKAALLEYSERGVAALTMDGVAKRAGVGKSTIYLRWQNKDDLLSDAVRDFTDEIIHVTDTGTLRGDLYSLAVAVGRWYFDPMGWAAFRIAVDYAGSGEQAGDVGDTLHTAHRIDALEVVRRGIARGELAQEVPGQLLLELLYGAMGMRRLVHRVLEPELAETSLEEYAAQVADFLMTGLTPWLVQPAG